MTETKQEQQHLRKQHLHAALDEERLGQAQRRGVRCLAGQDSTRIKMLEVSSSWQARRCIAVF